MLVKVTSICFAGPGLLLAPEAEPGDGLLGVAASPRAARALRRRRTATISITCNRTPLHVDTAVELATLAGAAMIRERLAGRFNGHDVIGEEFPDRPGRGHPMA